MRRMKRLIAAARAADEPSKLPVDGELPIVPPKTPEPPVIAVIQRGAKSASRPVTIAERMSPPGRIKSAHRLATTRSEGRRLVTVFEID
jgi:hypothetical protein